eukprot:1038341-Pleurochrysis_carterae.AAC.1
MPAVGRSARTMPVVVCRVNHSVPFCIELLILLRITFPLFWGSEYAIGKCIFDFYCLIFAERRQQYEHRFCPQPLTPYYGKGGTGMSNCCDSPTHIFDEHHPLAVSYMRCGHAGKENTTIAEATVRSRRERLGAFPRQTEGGENSLKNSLINFERAGDVPSWLARRFAGLARRFAGL